MIDEDGILTCTDFAKFTFLLRVTLNDLLEQQKNMGLQAIQSNLGSSKISGVEDNEKAQHNHCNLRQLFLYFHWNLSLSLSFLLGMEPGSQAIA